MKKWMVLFLVLSMIASSYVVYANDDILGSLVIVGGALRADNDAVYEAFIERAGGASEAKIGIIPAASGSPHKYAKMFIEDMTSRGLDASQVVVLPIAVKDDSKSKDIDESTWSKGGYDEAVAKQVESLTGIWFVGGDQLRITEVLLKPDGSNTPVLDAIWDIYKKGAVIGGSSAGAAIMSKTMIAGGDSLSALAHGYADVFDDSTMDYQNEGELIVTQGLGFFGEGIVDQHFDRKARLGRLAVVTYDQKDKYPIGFGIEENTAMIVDQKTKTIHVAGTGGVIILDASHAKRSDGYEQFKVSYIEGRDQYDLMNKKALMDEDKYTTVGYEYNYTTVTQNGGAMAPNQRFRDLIAFELIDNEAKTEIKTYLFGENNDGFEFAFSYGDGTEGYWGQSGAADLYSFENVYMNIKPVSIVIQPVQNQPQTYTVKAGDVLWKIARDHQMTLDEILKLNPLSNPNLIKIGQTIIITK